MGYQSQWSQRETRALLLVSTLVSCQPPPLKGEPFPEGGRTEAAVPTDATGAPEVPRPRLVVTVVLDQFPAWALKKYLQVLPPDGAIRAGISRGYWHQRLRFEHATTLTGPGHASLFTGVPLSVSGVVGNQMYDPELSRFVPTVSDPEFPIWGTGGQRGVSSRRLRVRTVGEALKKQRPGARVVSLSTKDRAAVLSAGRNADAVLWYDVPTGRFTSSTFYGASEPAWLRDFNAEPAARALNWEASDPQLLAQHGGADDASGEANWQGLGTTFPHRVSDAEVAQSVRRATPFATLRLLALAERAVEEFSLGQDDLPDLLSLSISSPDYIGHTFGPDSWEYLENLLVVDRALGGFLRRLEERTTIAVLLTSDHGVAPLPERAQERGIPSKRVWPQELRAEVERELSERFGGGPYIAAFNTPLIVLGDAGIARRAAVVPVIQETLQRSALVHQVYDIRAFPDDLESSSPLEQAVAASVFQEAPGDLYVVFEEHVVVGAPMERGKGTNHGSPWDYDREVPLIVWGLGVSTGETSASQSQLRGAATIHALLGLPGRWAGQRPLPGVRGVAQTAIVDP